MWNWDFRIIYGTGAGLLHEMRMLLDWGLVYIPQGDSTTSGGLGKGRGEGEGEGEGEGSAHLELLVQSSGLQSLSRGR